MKTLRTLTPKFRLVLLVGVLLLCIVVVARFEAQAQNTGAAATSWTGMDIGVAPSPGSSQLDESGVALLTSSGEDVGGTSDSLHYLYQLMNGDGEIVARVLNMGGTNQFAKAGIMLRDGLSAGSRNLALLLTAGQEIGCQWRTVSNGHTGHDLAGQTGSVPYWVKIVRSGNWVGGYCSADGNTWKLMGWQNLDGLAQQVYVGLLAANNGGTGTTMATFDQMAIASVNLADVLSPAIGNGEGLNGDFFDNRHLFGVPSVNRVDAEINFGYPDTITVSSPKHDEFAERWTGEIQAQFTEPYALSLSSDDGVRMWLNENLVIDNWSSHSNKEMTAIANLVAGQHYLIRIEYFQNHGGSKLRLAWSSPSTPKEVIPQSQLYSQPTDVDGNGLPDIWEQHYFGQTGVDANADPDGDGLTNLQEWRRHWNPTNALNWGVPNNWTHGDIENRGYSDASAGDASYNDGIFTVSSKGREIWQRVDDFHYVYQALGTNGVMVVRVLGMDGVNTQAKAGLMVRETLDNNARNFLLALTADNNLWSQFRSVAGDITSKGQVQTNTASVNWLKLVRNNDWIGGYISMDGTNWMLYDWQTLTGLPTQVFVGMFVTAQSHKGTRNPSTTAQFDQALVKKANFGEWMTPVVGGGNGLMGKYRNDSLLYLPGMTNFVDAQVNFNWIHNAAIKILNPDYYGVCWSGEIQAQFTEPYSFSLQCRAEDWVRVWLNDQLIIDGWRALHPDTKFNQVGTINLVAGQRYLFRVEMFNDHGKGMARLKWKSPSTPERLVSQGQLFSQPLDADGNGLPDSWEQLYFGHLGVDPNADPDGDGLSNLQEYQYHTNPTRTDTDNDGMPDAWEIAHGLDPQFNDAGMDYDNTGWNNLQKYLYGLDPFNTDANNDGLPDNLEVRYLGLDVTTSHANLASVVAKACGAQATNLLGRWQVDGNDIYCLDRRGGVDFNLTVTNADKYVLNLIGTQNQTNPFEARFKLLLGIDGQSLGHFTLNAGTGTNGEVSLVLPYLNAGTHTVHVFWDGFANYSSLRIKQVQFLSVAGADMDHNGVKDWADRMVSDESGFDRTNMVIGTYTSPVCLEGRDPYPNLLQLTNNLTNALSPSATTDGRWFVNVPLGGTRAMVQASFQNGSSRQARQIQWQQLNLLTATNGITLRKGDSLWLTALPTGVTNGNLQITYDTNVLTGKAAKGIVCKFTAPGVYILSGIFTAASGATQTGNITVDVVQANLPNVPPAAWTGMQRNFNLSSQAPECTLQADSRLTCFLTGTNASGGVRLALGTTENEEATLLARLGINGPVLDSVRVSGFDLWSGNQAYTKVVQTYPDGSQLVEMLLISSPVEPDVSFVLEPIVSGVIFEDGSLTKTLTASNFDALGQCVVRFVRPATTHTSVCHQIKAYQGNYQIGYRH
jgi:hypothetical protein